MSKKVSLAVLALDIADAEVIPTEVHILPSGSFRSDDGRPHDVEAWVLTADLAQKLIDQVSNRKNDIVIDYEHQTLYKEMNGQMALAAGWFKSLEWRENGLYATGITWTEKAKKLIQSKEYRYASAVFLYDKKTGEVRQIISFALTNTPALSTLDSLTSLTRTLLQEDSMDKSTKEQSTEIATLNEQLKKKDESIASLSEEIAALKKQLADKDAAAIEAENNIKNSLIDAALTAKQIYPAEKEFLAALSLDHVKLFLKVREGVTLLTRQTEDARPAVDEVHSLSEEEIAHCTKVGLDPKEYAETKKRIFQ